MGRDPHPAHANSDSRRSQVCHAWHQWRLWHHCREAGMNRMETSIAPALTAPAEALVNALPHPIIMVGEDGRIIEANVAAEAFFEASAAMLRRHSVGDLVPF